MEAADVIEDWQHIQSDRCEMKVSGQNIQSIFATHRQTNKQIALLGKAVELDQEYISKYY